VNRPAHVPEGVVVDYDAFGQYSTNEMLAKVDEWRPLGEVLWTDRNGGHWLVVSHLANREVLTDTSRFQNWNGTAVTPKGDRPPMVPLELDGEEHQKYRKVLNPLFAPNRVRSIEGDARLLARELLSGISAKDECDVVAEFARPLASSLFLSLVDWPLEDRHILEEMVERELNAPGATAEEIAAVKAQALADIAAYCAGQVRKRRENPTDDMTSVLMRAEIDGEPIPDVRLVSMLLLLMIAGLDTTQSVLSSSIAKLAADGALQASVRSQTAALPEMVEELIRFTGPAGPNRTVTETTEFHGVKLESGDRIHCMVQAANRDPAEFELPNDVLLDRLVNRHLTFGVGPHKCIGAAMARIVLNVALEEFHKHIDHYTLVEAQSHLGGVWGMNHVVIRFTDR
jgi:cytochrome P450